MPSDIVYESVHCGYCWLSDQSQGCLIQVHTSTEAGIIQSIKRGGRSLPIDKPSCERVNPKLFCFSRETGHLGRESQRPGASLITERTRNCRNIAITLKTLNERNGLFATVGSSDTWFGGSLVIRITPNMSDVRRLDEVTIFNDKLTFLIPHEWIEAESGEDGTYLYQAPDARSGFFRVSLLTVNNVARPAERLEELFSNHKNVSANETTGNLVRRTEKDSEEDGAPLHIFYWFVGGCVPPDSVYEAVFSYTVLSDDLHNDDTRTDVTLLEQLVAEARFNPAVRTNGAT
jgi:hypothetical protein